MGSIRGGRAARPQKGQAVGEPSAGKIRGFEEIAAAVSIEQEGVFGVSNLPDGGILEMLLGQRSSQGKDIWCKGIYLFAYIPSLEAGGIAQAALQPVSEGEKRDKQEEEQGHWKIPGQPCRKAADIEGEKTRRPGQQEKPQQRQQKGARHTAGFLLQAGLPDAGVQ